MTTLSALYPTLLDFGKRMGPDGKIQSTIIESLMQTNDMLDDLVFQEGNLPTGNLTTIRTGIPLPSFRKIYGYVAPQKSTTIQVTDTCGMLESFAVVDCALADLNGNSAEWRMSEERAFIQGFNKKVAQSIFYANEKTTPEGFTGLAPRYNSASAENSENILTSASTPDNSDNSSIWLVVWGKDTCFPMFPKGSKAGLSLEDMGKQVEDSSGSKRLVYMSHYRWDLGLCLPDWQYVVRIQVDAEDLLSTYATGPNLVDLMSQATELIPNLNAGRPAFYMNRSLRSMLKRQMRTASAYQLTTEQLTRGNGDLIHVPMFEGIPIRRCDVLTSTESALSTSGT